VVTQPCNHVPAQHSGLEVEDHQPPVTIFFQDRIPADTDLWVGSAAKEVA